ncbi:aldo keto reductase [Moniliophthora roreri MCA 2997]|uniref:Aldo keto reductase n=1 Tax=Moniliophthora roreri (strain MCA 2997) TaxID=1381753 RepID=V2YMQ1_MONRO|nr:aldo keto reductase [Moniliophthora roreri MCA 2997]
MSQTTQPTFAREIVRLGALSTPRLWTGLWQLSGNAWGSAPVSKIRAAMKSHVEMGYTAFADHYGSAEIIFGQFCNSLPNRVHIVGATKWCVFKELHVDSETVRSAVLERTERMQTDHVDLLQFHWQNYANKDYMKALENLHQLKEEGLITELGLCNFDTIRTDEICTQLGPGVIVSNQVQFSVIDTRPLHGMSDVCEKHGIRLLTYGTLCGGFLSDEWLNKPVPDLYSGQLTPSQRKYLDMILNAWGNWELFQALLRVLRNIGDRRGGLSIANVATRWVLDHPFVGAVIVGARLGLAEHTQDNSRVYSFSLSARDNQDIEAVLDRSNGRRMITSIGDCGAEYR